MSKPEKMQQPKHTVYAGQYFDEVDSHPQRHTSTLPRYQRTTRSNVLHSRAKSEQRDQENQLQYARQSNRTMELRQTSVERQVNKSTAFHLNGPERAPETKFVYDGPPHSLSRRLDNYPGLNRKTTGLYAATETKAQNGSALSSSGDPYWLKSRSHRDVSRTDCDLVSIDELTSPAYRHLTNNLMKARNSNEKRYSTAPARSIEEINNQSGNSPKQVEFEQENNPENEEKQFFLARNKFQRLAEMSQNQEISRGYAKPKPAYGIKIGSVGALRERFSSWSNVAEEPTKPKELNRVKK